MTTQTDKIIESVKAAVKSAYMEWWQDAAQEVVMPDSIAEEVARRAILAHTEALMENVTEEMRVAAWNAHELHVDFAKPKDGPEFDYTFLAMLQAHKEQMK